MVFASIKGAVLVPAEWFNDAIQARVDNGDGATSPGTTSLTAVVPAPGSAVMASRNEQAAAELKRGAVTIFPIIPEIRMVQQRTILRYQGKCLNGRVWEAEGGNGPQAS